MYPSGEHIYTSHLEPWQMYPGITYIFRLHFIKMDLSGAQK